MKFSQNQSVYLKNLGKNIRKLRKEKGYSIELFCNEFELDYRQFGRIERGEINTSVLSLLKIADALEVEITELFKFKK